MLKSFINCLFCMVFGLIIKINGKREKKLYTKELSGIKILGNGKLEKKLTIKANIFTNSAITKIEELGGKAEVI